MEYKIDVSKHACTMFTKLIVDQMNLSHRPILIIDHYLSQYHFELGVQTIIYILLNLSIFLIVSKPARCWFTSTLLRSDLLSVGTILLNSNI